MKRIASLLLAGLAGSAQAAGLDAMMNPLSALGSVGMNNPFAPNPFASGPFGSNPFVPGPFGYGSPLGGLASPLGLGNPLGLGAIAAPLGLGLLNPLGGGMGNAMYPAMQVSPNMMSYQHYNQLTNPYAGGPFAGNPYIQRSLPNPFAAPAFSPSIPTMPNMPFAAPQQQGGFAGFVPQPQQQLPYGMMGYGGYAPAPAQQPPMPWPSQSQSAPPVTPWTTPASQPAGGAFLPFAPPASPAPAQPAAAVVAPQQSLLPFFAAPPQPAPAPQPATKPAPVAAPATAPQSLLPFFPAPPQPAPAPQPAAESMAKPATSPVAPLDPASFMQMLMKPAEVAR